MNAVLPLFLSFRNKDLFLPKGGFDPGPAPANSTELPNGPSAQPCRVPVREKIEIFHREAFVPLMLVVLPPALETMEKQKVRRLPVVNLDGRLAGILSIGDITLHAEKKEGKRIPDLSTDDVVEAYQGIRVRQLTEQVAQL